LIPYRIFFRAAFVVFVVELKMYLLETEKNIIEFLPGKIPGQGEQGFGITIRPGFQFA